MEKVYKLDKLDKKILHELDKNSRIPASKLAKKLKISREVADYRIKRLIEHKIIRSFFTHIHSEKLGFTNYEVYFKTKGMGKEEEGKLIEFFCRHDMVFQVISCDGAYDLIVHLVERDIYKLNAIIQECLHSYGHFFISKDITLITKLLHCNKKFLLDKNNSYPEPTVYGIKKGFMEIDSKDKESLRLLSNNSRMQATEIAGKLGLTSAAVIYRIKELENKKIIDGYSCAINAPRLGLAYCKVMLVLDFGNTIRERELHQFCLQHLNVTRFLYCIGHWDFEIDVMMDSMQDFHKFLKELKGRFSEIIRDYEYVTISESHKFMHFIEAYKSNIDYF